MLAVVVVAGESLRGGAAAQRPRRGMMHVVDEKLVQLGGGLELRARVPCADERPFHHLGTQDRRVGAELGQGFRGEGGVLGDEGVVQRVLVGDGGAERERDGRVSAAG